jgi:CRISPR type I-E-associated protein CasB/Cse2
VSRKPSDYDTLAHSCTKWWLSLQEREVKGKTMPRDRAALAELRRIGVIALTDGPAVDIGLALGSSAFRKLIADLRGESFRQGSYVKRWLDEDERCVEPFAIAAATLAHIRSDAGRKERGATARMLGAARGESDSTDDHLFAEARFKRLIRTRNDWPGLLAQARRIAAILEKEAPIGDLGASLILWNAEPGVIRDWAFQYYQRDFAPAASEKHAAPAEAAPIA